MSYNFREFRDPDSSKLVEIFNYYIENSYAAYREEKIDLSFVDILKHISRGYPFYVIEDDTAGVVGFGMIHPYHPAEVFKRTAELSYFLAPGHTRRGIGQKLLGLLTEKARSMGVDSLVASISSRNEESISFHLKHGFVECGRFKRIGRKWDRDFDVVWMQKFI
ncbi:MAG: GNAT family N-acetyltransferase [Candidatus Zixiibacteriota bacterium]